MTGKKPLGMLRTNKNVAKKYNEHDTSVFYKKNGK